jgi:hypothetical protein
MWMFALALVGCGEGGNEVGSAQTVSVMEEIVPCNPGDPTAETDVTAPGIGRSIYVIEGCTDTGQCFTKPDGIYFDTLYVESDALRVKCTNNADIVEIRIRWLAIE